MVWRFAVALRDRAEELAMNGYVRVPLDKWAELASEANAPRSAGFLTRVLDAWVAGDEKHPPLLARVAGERDAYTLHESRKAALDFLHCRGGQALDSEAHGRENFRESAIHRAALQSEEGDRVIHKNTEKSDGGCSNPGRWML